VTSADGTKIAYEQQGFGPALIIVDGALSTSGGKAALRALLAPQLTVLGYDRRGRGDSGDTLRYAVNREIDDIQALIEVAGGRAALYGHFSGAALALDAALQLGGSVRKIAMYEGPYNDDPAAQQAWGRYLEQLAEALAGGRHGDAVALFMAYIGTPAAQIDRMRQQVFWPAMAALGPTLAYDHTAILGKDAAVPAGASGPAVCSGVGDVRNGQLPVHSRDRPPAAAGDAACRAARPGGPGTRCQPRRSRPGAAGVPDLTTTSAAASKATGTASAARRTKRRGRLARHHVRPYTLQPPCSASAGSHATATSWPGCGVIMTLGLPQRRVRHATGKAQLSRSVVLAGGTSLGATGLA
jgi:pimeloyl-ACP methyl ester carboxylesterase